MGKNISGGIRCRFASIIVTVLFFCLLIAACNPQPEISTFDTSVIQTVNTTVTQTTTFDEEENQNTIIKSSFPTQMPGVSTETTTQLELESDLTSKAETTTAVPEPTSAFSSQQTITTATESQNESRNRNEIDENFYWITLDEKIKQRITGFSYPEDDSNIQIHYDDLRYIKLLHYDFAGDIHEGELIVHAALADEVMEIFYLLYLAEYPLTSVLLVDEFGQSADDTLSMEANNTSAFNYRLVTGTKTLSRHSFGAAIDINPMLNPYIVGDRIMPENGDQYADRSLDFPGKIDHDDLCYRLFKDKGWTWGGDWAGDKDYQHFSKKIN